MQNSTVSNTAIHIYVVSVHKEWVIFESDIFPLITCLERLHTYFQARDCGGESFPFCQSFRWREYQFNSHLVILSEEAYRKCVQGIKMPKPLVGDYGPFPPFRMINPSLRRQVSPRAAVLSRGYAGR